MELPVSEQEERELREIVLLLASVLKFDFQAVWRRCDAGWKRRVRSYPIHILEREYRFLISCCGLRRIARLYAQIFKYSSISTILAGDYVRRRGLEDAQHVRELMQSYNALMGKYE